MTVRIAILGLALAALVIVPFLLWQELFVSLSEQLLAAASDRWLVAGVVVALLALDVLLPIPSSLVSVGAGAALGFSLGTLACLVGMTGGCLLGYLLGAWLGEARVGRVVREQDRRIAKRFFTRYGAGALTLARPVPVLAEVSVVMAGVSGMKLAPLLRYTAGANLGIALAYAAVGHYAMRVDSFLLAFAGALLIPAAALALVRLTRGRAATAD